LCGSNIGFIFCDIGFVLINGRFIGSDLLICRRISRFSFCCLFI